MAAGEGGKFVRTISYGTFDFDFAVELLEYIMAKCWTQVSSFHPSTLYRACGSEGLSPYRTALPCPVILYVWVCLAWQHPRERVKARDKVNLFLPTAEELLADDRKDLLQKVSVHIDILYI